MDPRVSYKDQIFSFQRYPETTNKSLRAYSTADILMAEYVKDFKEARYAIFNDRMGVLGTLMNQRDSMNYLHYSSQEKALDFQYKKHQTKETYSRAYLSPDIAIQESDFYLVKMPKSVDFLDFMLDKIAQSAPQESQVVLGFMTKYFTKSWLEIAQKYFDGVEQTKAWKKARLMILSKPKKNLPAKEFTHNIEWQGTVLKQYYGVFSAKNIDLGTRFLLENFTLKPNEELVLDLACGNGIIGHHLLQQNPKIELHASDDFLLAIESAKMNISSKNAHFYCENDLNQINLPSLDLIITNPPFHFENENNIEVSIQLFRQAKRKLKAEGRLVIVANRHLNYTTHLKHIFTSVSQLLWNEKFEILEAKY
ncbi:MAG: methyltransferase [Flavobacteriales bacterium]|jgi:16S rRNA G1207 methylase RsmC|nr:methyltransferase [Flavobacteriales bacterium]